MTPLASLSASVLTLVADDLTGACDATVAFAECGLATEVMITGSSMQMRDVQALSTESRDVPTAEAVEWIAQLAGSVLKDSLFFKKIDSVFRGNTFVELVALVTHLPSAVVVLAPSYPTLARTMRNGKVSFGHAESVDVHARLVALGVPVKLVRADCSGTAIAVQIRTSMDDARRLLLCDAETDEDLYRIVAGVRKLQTKVLWVGSGGLAKALARSLSLNPAEPPLKRNERTGSVILLIGSNHPVTELQVNELQARVGINAGDIGQAVTTEKTSTHLWRVVRRCTQASDIHRACSAVGDISCLLMTGGDTAMLACRALGMRSLDIRREFAPGVVQGIARGGMVDGTTVLLKSGGFGTTNLLCEVVEHFCPPQRTECE